MLTIIKPTVGRKLWFFASAKHYEDFKAGLHEAQPFDATVIFVHNDNCVNIAAISHHGQPDVALGVMLAQEGDESEPTGAHCRWMPYQTAQQAKADTKANEPAATPTPALTPAPDAKPDDVGNKFLAEPPAGADDPASTPVAANAANPVPVIDQGTPVAVASPAP